MKIISWNCRGSRGTPSVRNLRSLLSSTQPDILFASETRCSEAISHNIFNNLPFPHSFCVPSQGLSGGLWLLWSHQVSITIKNSSSNFIIAEVEDDSPAKKWIMVGVYGPPNRHHRKGVWQQITQLSNSFDLPWCCTGDFNAILSAAEKSGGSPVTEAILWDFKSFVHDTGLLDLGYSGPAFTWTNKRQRRFNIRERLDRCLVDASWQMLFPRAEVFHLPAFGSDHCPILLMTSPQGRRRNLPFKFESMLVQFSEFNSYIRDYWKSSKDQGDLASKCQKLVPKIKVWKRKNLVDWKNKIENLKAELLKVQSQPVTDLSLNEEGKMQQELGVLLQAEEAHWHQLSRSKWINYGDKNTKYFHLFAMNRKQKNKISWIQGTDGNFTSEAKAISDIFIKYFSDIYMSCGTLNILPAIKFTGQEISNAENSALLSIPSKDAIYEVIKNMHPTKAPGPDGFPAIFYQSFWSILADDVVTCIQDFFIKRVMKEGVNHTHITLIPKKKECKTPADFRPISLTNVTYKIIAKILANRLKFHLSSIISPTQSAFLAGRYIGDNIIIAQELIHYMKQRRGKEVLYALKLDMSKAFDRLEWSFIDGMLEKIGLNAELYMQCISTASFSVVINGHPEGHFVGTRGIRQGCPLSPFIFILAMEALSRQLTVAQDMQLISGIQIARNSPPINHLLFADDILIFGRASLPEIHILKAILGSFSHMSGQVINFDKSSIYLSPNCPQQLALEIKQLLLVKDMNPDEIYLGGCIFGGHPQRRFCKSLIAKTNSRLKGWKSTHLSHAGRTTLLKSSIATLPTYSMCTTSFPSNVCKKLDNIHRDFWWGKDNTKRNLYLKNWKSFQQPLKLGGLGIKNMQLTNLSLSCKLAWRFCTEPHALWVKVLSGWYLKNSDYWGAFAPSTSSPTWKALLHIRGFLYHHTSWLIGNGKIVNIWRDNWVKNFSHILTLVIVDANTPCYVYELIKPGNSSWDENIIRRYFDAPAAMAILNTPLGSADDTDSLIWKANSCGRFSTKTAYNLLLQDKDTGQSSNFEPNKIKCLLGVKGIAPRVWTFLWRCLQNALPTKSNLFSRRIIDDARCLLCNEQDESIDHLFMRCTWTRDIWVQLGLFDTQHHISLSTWLNYIAANNPDRKKLVLTGTLMWFIWKARCDKHFKGTRWCKESVINRAILFFNQYWRTQKPTAHRDTKSAHWNRPMVGQIKINVDGSTKQDGASTAIVVRNSTGEHIMSAAKFSPPVEPLSSEARAMVMALQCCAEKGWTNVTVESDSLTIVTLLNDQELPIPWTILREVNSCRRLLKRLTNISVQHISRSANTAAHILANHSRIYSLDLFCDDHLGPICIQNCLSTER